MQVESPSACTMMIIIKGRLFLGEPQKNKPSLTRLLVTLIQRRHVIMKNLFDATVANQVKTRL
ncbi:MAG: hypothetical protein WAK33_17060, partial [Silvibacterium sp.]